MLLFGMNRLVFTLLLAMTLGPVMAQQEDRCIGLLTKGDEANELGNYEQALLLFDSLLAECPSKITRLNGLTGKAKALNGLARYSEALPVAGAALRLAQQKSVNAVFEQAYAHFALQQLPEAQSGYAQLEKRLSLSRSNREKAFILSRLAILNQRQNKLAEASQLQQKALALDPANPSMFVLLGDIKAAGQQLEEAFNQYEKAEALRASAVLIARKKATAFTSAMQEKYLVKEAKELRLKMGIADKQQYCELWKALFALGYSNNQEELAFTLICL